MDEISETIKKNKEIAEKFSRIEESLTSFTQVKDLFENCSPVFSRIQHPLCLDIHYQAAGSG